MDESNRMSYGTLPRAAAVGMMLAAALGILALLTWVSGKGTGLDIFLEALVTSITEGGLAGLIVVAAGGYGYLLVGRVAGDSAARGLKVATACGVGLWMLGAVMLALGSSFRGAMTGWLWWPVVGAGVLLAAWQGRRTMEQWRIAPRFDGRVLAWVVVAASVGIWAAGAVRPPGWGGLLGGEFYDILEYHLQVPREFYNAGQIRHLPHNVYSHYPLGVQMLSLLAMCLRGGAYEGMYAAKFLHGAFGALTVLSVFSALKPKDQTRGRYAAVLLVTTPAALYLGRLAMVELAQVFYLAAALMWLRDWLAGRGARSACCLGLMLGAACATKYLAIGLVAGPVLAVVLVFALAGRQWRLIWHAVAAGLLTLALQAPWLARNLAHTGNPVFPLATGLFGRGHWSAESQKRWVDGHGPEARPPVPVPRGWRAVPGRTRLELFVGNFMTNEFFGRISMLIAGIAIALALADWKSTSAWDRALIGTLAGQLAVWCAFTHEMPWRFIVPAIGPVCLLAAGGLQRLSNLAANPFRRGATADSGPLPWGRVPAVGVLVTAAFVNLFTAYVIVEQDALGKVVRPLPGEFIAAKVEWYSDIASLPEASRVLLVGEAKAFYLPEGTVYATAFDSHPLAEMVEKGLKPGQIARRLREMGVTHILVNWQELWRLAPTYGYPASLSAGLYDQWRTGRQGRIEVLDALTATEGLRVVQQRWPGGAPASAPGPTPAPDPPWDPFYMPQHWPVTTLYALPWAPATRPAPV